MTIQASGKFIFAGHKWSPKERKATFIYEVNHKEEKFTFTETLVFPQSEQTQDIPKELVETLLNNLLLALGISYYKIFCPKELIITILRLPRSKQNSGIRFIQKDLENFFIKIKSIFAG